MNFMKLYRGYQQDPGISRKLMEWDGLNAVHRKAVRHTQVFEDFEAQMGATRLARWDALEREMHDRLAFTDEATARAFAGANGFLVEIHVHVDEAARNFRGRKSVTPPFGEPHEARQFLFSYHNIADFQREGRAELIDVRRLREEGDATTDRPRGRRL